MPANSSGPVMLWQWFMGLGNNGLRTPQVGPNPYPINSYYSQAIFHYRMVERGPDLITIQRVSILGSLNSNGFVPVNFAAADFHTVAQWRGNVSQGVGQIRYCKGTDSSLAGLTRRVQTLVPRFLMLEWNTSAVGDPGTTVKAEIWATFLGPEVVGTN